MTRDLSFSVLLLAATSSLLAQPEASIRVADEMAPAGGLAVIQIELTEPMPILTGDVTVGKRGNVLGGLCGIGLFSSTLDVVGVGTRMGDQTRVRFLGFSGQVGNTEDLPVMVMAFEVAPTASIGSQGSLDIVSSSLRLESPNGTIYRNDIKQGSVTVGGISITEVIPASGVVPAGAEIRFRGVGFSSDSRVDIDGVQLSSVRVAGPSEIIAVAGQTFRIENRRIRLRNRDGGEDFFYSFTSAKLTPESSNPLLQSAIPIYSPTTVSAGTIASSPDLLGLSLRNPGAASTDVRVRAFDTVGSLIADRTVSLAAEGQSTLTPSEWLGGADLSDATVVAVESSQPVQALGLRYADGTFTPAVLSDDPPPVPAPGATPRISSGGWVLATLAPVQNEIAPLAITTLFGEGFAPDGFSISAGPEDLVGNSLPTRLGGVCVEIDGAPAPLFFVSSDQINLQARERSTGAASAVVVRACGTAEEMRSAPEAVGVSPRLPAWFVFGRDVSGVNPIAALHGGGPEVISDASPAAPGEAVSLFATGLGLTNPHLSPGEVPQLKAPGGLFPVTGRTTIRIGNRILPPEDVLFVGAAPCCAGLYQVVVRVPADAAAGSLPVEIAVDGVTSLPGPFLPVSRQ